MREMKDSGIEWIGAIPINWDIAQFKKILIRNDGGLWGNDPSGQDDILVLRSTEQTIDGKWDIQSPAYRDLSNVSNVQEYLVKCGDLLITKSSGSDLHIGKTTIVDELIESLHCSFSNFIQRLRVCSKMNPRYYWYILNSNIARGQFVYLQNSTSGIGNINSKNINEIEVPIPPLDIQHTIADYLDRKCSQIDAIIARQQEVIEKLKAYKLSVITEAVTKGLNPNVPMKDSGVEWIGEIPEHWSIVPLTKQLESIVDYRGKTPEKVDDGIFLVTARNIKNGMIDYSISSEYVKAEDYDEIMRRGIPQIGDVLFTTEAPLGQVANVDRTDIALAQRIIKFSTKKHLDSYFLKYWIMSVGFQNFLMTLSTGSTAVGIKASKLFMLPVPLAPMQEQKQIVTYLDKKCERIESVIDRKQALIDRFTDYKKSLIYEVVTGKKEV